MEPANSASRTKAAKVKFSGAVQVRGMIRRVWRHRYLEIDGDGVLRYYEAINPLCMGGGSVSCVKNRDQVIEREMQAFSIPVHLNHETVSIEKTDLKSAKIVANDATSDCVKYASERCSLDDGDHVLVEQPRNCTADESLQVWDSINIPDSTENYSESTGSLPIENVEVFIAPDMDGQSSIEEFGSTSTYQRSNMSRNSKSQTDQQGIQTLHHRIHDHRPKAVMTILSARLIDVTNLRDMHVGLPKGTFGFVFCGRQIFTEMQSNSLESSDNPDALSVSADHFEVNGDICHPLSILNVSDHYFDTSRDYLCSVSTEEEARKWVAALKWAVKVSSGRKNEKTALQQLIPNSQRKSLFMTLPPAAVNASQDMANSLLSDSSTVLTDSSIHNGYTIVAKVKKFFVKKTDRLRLIGIKCETFFEISLLLLGPSHVMQRSTKRGDNQRDDSAWSIEQRTIHRSLQEIKNFASSLVSESKGDSTLRHVAVTMQNLSFTNIMRIKQNLNKSIECADAALRIITSDPELCDTFAVKQFLGLTSHSTACDLNESRIKHRNMRSETLTVEVGQSVDDFVKCWLLSEEIASKATESLKVYAMLLLGNPIVESILSVKLAYFAKCAVKFWWTNPSCMIRIRADALLTLFGGFFYLGYNMGSSRMIDKHLKHEPLKKNDTMTCQTSPAKEKSTVPMEDVSIHEEISLYDSVATSDDFQTLSSPLPMYPNNGGSSCWSCPDHKIFNVRGKTYLKDRIKHPSGPSPFKCRGVDMWLTDNPERNISRLPYVLGGKLGEEDTFLVNFLLPFGNFVMYFSVSSDMPDNVANVWKKFKSGDQLYRDSRLKLLPVVVDGPWIVKKAVGNGTAPALLSQSIPLQYYFTMGEKNKKDIYEVDVIISASRIAKGILNVVKSHTNKLTIALGIIIEATTEAELPEIVLCSSQLHSLDLEHCPHLPKYFLEDEQSND